MTELSRCWLMYLFFLPLTVAFTCHGKTLQSIKTYNMITRKPRSTTRSQDRLHLEYRFVDNRLDRVIDSHTTTQYFYDATGFLTHANYIYKDGTGLFLRAENTKDLQGRLVQSRMLSCKQVDTEVATHYKIFESQGVKYIESDSTALEISYGKPSDVIPAKLVMHGLEDGSGEFELTLMRQGEKGEGLIGNGIDGSPILNIAKVIDLPFSGIEYVEEPFRYLRDLVRYSAGPSEFDEGGGKFICRDDKDSRICQFATPSYVESTEFFKRGGPSVQNFQTPDILIPRFIPGQKLTMFNKTILPERINHGGIDYQINYEILNGKKRPSSISTNTDMIRFNYDKDGDITLIESYDRIEDDLAALKEQPAENEVFFSWRAVFNY